MRTFAESKLAETGAFCALGSCPSRMAAQQSDEAGHRIARFQLGLYRLASTFEGSAKSGGVVLRRLTQGRKQASDA